MNIFSPLEQFEFYKYILIFLSLLIIVTVNFLWVLFSVFFEDFRELCLSKAVKDGEDNLKTYIAIIVKFYPQILLMVLVFIWVLIFYYLDFAIFAVWAFLILFFVKYLNSETLEKVVVSMVACGLIPSYFMLRQAFLAVLSLDFYFLGVFGGVSFGDSLMAGGVFTTLLASLTAAEHTLTDSLAFEVRRIIRPVLQDTALQKVIKEMTHSSSSTFWDEFIDFKIARENPEPLKVRASLFYHHAFIEFRNKSFMLDIIRAPKFEGLQFGYEYPNIFEESRFKNQLGFLSILDFQRSAAFDLANIIKKNSSLQEWVDFYKNTLPYMPTDMVRNVFILVTQEINHFSRSVSHTDDWRMVLDSEVFDNKKQKTSVINILDVATYQIIMRDFLEIYPNIANLSDVKRGFLLPKGKSPIAFLTMLQDKGGDLTFTAYIIDFEGKVRYFSDKAGAKFFCLMSTDRIKKFPSEFLGLFSVVEDSKGVLSLKDRGGQGEEDFILENLRKEEKSVEVKTFSEHSYLKAAHDYAPGYKKFEKLDRDFVGIPYASFPKLALEAAEKDVVKLLNAKGVSCKFIVKS